MSAPLLSAAELKFARDGWPAGTLGTLVEVFDDGALFEIADHDGCTVAMIGVPYGELSILGQGKQASASA